MPTFSKKFLTTGRNNIKAVALRKSCGQKCGCASRIFRRSAGSLRWQPRSRTMCRFGHRYLMHRTFAKLAALEEGEFGRPRYVQCPVPSPATFKSMPACHPVSERSKVSEHLWPSSVFRVQILAKSHILARARFRDAPLSLRPLQSPQCQAFFRSE